MKIKFLQAYNGDCIFIQFCDEDGVTRHILIDGGTPATYKIDKNKKGKSEYGPLRNEIDNIRDNNHKIDLLIITHIDQDHIGGVLKWFEDDPSAHELITEVWFNSGAAIAKFLKDKENPSLHHNIKVFRNNLTSVKEGIKFSDYILDKEIYALEIILQGQHYRRYGIDFKILSPNINKLKVLLTKWELKKEKLYTSGVNNDYNIGIRSHIEKDRYEPDKSFPNGSSMAFIVTHKNKNLLFSGDAHAEVIIEGLERLGYTGESPLPAVFVKLAHHGSANNTNSDLLNSIDTKTFVISTNGDKHGHPHKQLLARIINTKDQTEFLFNYENRMQMIFTDEDRQRYPFFSITKKNEITI